MTVAKPNVLMDGLYSQKEAAQLLGVERHTIRRWELEGHIRFLVRRCGGRKVTSGKQIIKCWESTY